MSHMKGFKITVQHRFRMLHSVASQKSGSEGVERVELQRACANDLLSKPPPSDQFRDHAWVTLRSWCGVQG